MKDAKGHGSEARGGDRRVEGSQLLNRFRQRAAHTSGVDQIGKPVPISPKAIGIVQKQALTGFSVTPSGKVPTTGFQVALQGRTEPQPLNLKNVAGDVAAHVAKNADVYKDPSMHIGGWNSPYTGKVHLEPSQNVKDRATAVRLGGERNQHSIWDNKNLTDIKTAGTGID